MTRIKAEIEMAAKQSVGVFGEESLNFWPVCPGCGLRHDQGPRSTAKVCETCLERAIRRKQWAEAMAVGRFPKLGEAAKSPLAHLCEQIGVNKGFWRRGKPPSFSDPGLKRHMLRAPFKSALYVWGPAGCHKTHMLCARAIAAAGRGYEARLTNWRAMCQEITATWRKGLSTESMAIKQFVELDYLAIDDLGIGMAELSSGQQQVAANTTYDVLDGRYNRGVHTDLSANWPVEHMAELFDERIHRRITEMTKPYYMGQEQNDVKE